MATTDRDAHTAADWRARYEATPERQGELFSTMSGVENEPLYSPDNVEFDYEQPSQKPDGRWRAEPSRRPGRLGGRSACASCGSRGRSTARDQIAGTPAPRHSMRFATRRDPQQAEPAAAPSAKPRASGEAAE